MNKLNKTFQQNQILTAAELNAIVNKVDEIVTLLSSLPEGTSSITDALVKAKIDEAKEELNRLLDDAIENLSDNIADLRGVVEGKTEVITEEEWALYRKKIDDTETEVAAIKLSYDGIDLVALRQTVDQINTWAGSITVDPGKIEILAALLDENDNLIINPASIIAAIVDKNGKLISEIAISADQVILDGDVTLTQGLTAMSGEITNLTSSTADIRTRLTAAEATVNNLNVPDIATIKQAVIDDIEAGNVTITGDLRYNRLIGNVTNAIGETVLGDGAYFVNVKQPTNNSEIVDITMPLEPILGLIIYIINLENARSLKANVPMSIYYTERDSNDLAMLSAMLVEANVSINPRDLEMGNAPILFLYDGEIWRLLNHNFIYYNSTTRS